jgi:hypothetical protein
LRAKSEPLAFAASLGKALKQFPLFGLRKNLIFRVPLHCNDKAAVWLFQRFDGIVL